MPHRTDVLVRGTLTLLIYPPLYFLFKKVLHPIMEIQSMSVWRYMTAIPFAFAVISIITTMEAFGHDISPVILAIRFLIIGGSVLVYALQRTQYEALAQSIEQTKAQRHDLRHQLAVIRCYSESGNNNKLTDYLDTLIAPEHIEHISDTNLCVILGIYWKTL